MSLRPSKTGKLDRLTQDEVPFTPQHQLTVMRSRVYLTGTQLVFLARVFLGRETYQVCCVSEALARPGWESKAHCFQSKFQWIMGGWVTMQKEFSCAMRG